MLNVAPKSGSQKSSSKKEATMNSDTGKLGLELNLNNNYNASLSVINVVAKSGSQKPGSKKETTMNSDTGKLGLELNLNYYL